MTDYYGNYRNKKFTDVWPELSVFQGDYLSSGLNIQGQNLTAESIKALYWLLYAEYGNSTIASFDEFQFKAQIFKTIFEYGPAWQKQLEIQKNLRGLTQDEIESGTKQIFNKALNPGTEPTTDELPMVSEQTVQKVKRGKLDGYAIILELLKTDVTQTFITHFKKYFLQIVVPERPLWYVTQSPEEEEEY